MAAKKSASAKKAKGGKASAKSKGGKAPKKKAAAPKAAAPRTAPRKAGTGTFDKVSKPRTKSQILGALADYTGLAKKEVSTVFESLGKLIGNDLKGTGQFTVPGLMKVVVVRKPATKARKGINPFTGQEMMFKAKPARNVVRVRPLKSLKEMV